MLAALRADVRAARERDPAARSTAELVLCYPGLHAVWGHRASSWLWRHGRTLLARLCSAFTQRLTGVDIHPAAVLGPGLFIDHAIGVVIGETAEVGTDVTIYHGVTLGGTSLDRGKRHPTVGDRVTIGAGAKVLGPITIGHDSRIGANAVVVKPVPPDSVVVGVPGHVIMRKHARGAAAPADLDNAVLPDLVGVSLRALHDRIEDLEARFDGGGPPDGRRFSRRAQTRIRPVRAQPVRGQRAPRSGTSRISRSDGHRQRDESGRHPGPGHRRDQRARPGHGQRAGQAGATVVITSRSAERAAAAAARLPGAVGVAADAGDEVSVARAADEAWSRLGGLDLLVNNAGLGMRTVNPRFMVEPQGFWDVPAAGFRAVIDVNLTGYFLMAREVTPRMLDAGAGRIVNISMNHTTMIRRGFVPYGPSRAGAEALSRIMAADLADSPVRVNMLLPGGATDTGMVPGDRPPG